MQYYYPDKNKKTWTKGDEVLPKKEERGISWIFSIVLVCVGLLFWIGYVFCATRLRFQREIGLVSEDFDFPLTNTYNSAKWWFMVFLPIIIGPFTFMFLILLLQYLFLTDTTTKDKFYFQANMVVWVIYLGILITAIIFSSIELGNANNKQHPLNVASDIRFCCASDIYLPLTKTHGCPTIGACGIAPISTHQLNLDTYFLLTFVFNIGLLIVCVVCIYLIFVLTQ